MKKGFFNRALAVTTAAVIGAGAITTMPAFSVKAQAAAQPAYSSRWTTQYPFLTLLKSSLLNSYTDANGIYEQLKLGVKYKTVSESDILTLVQEGYRIPAESLQKLYTEGWISGYLYKTATGQGYTASDFKDVFDASYYVSANPVIAQAVASGALAGDENSLFMNYLTCGIPAGLNGSSSFQFAAFEGRYPQVVTALGGSKLAEVVYYIMNKNALSLTGN